MPGKEGGVKHPLAPTIRGAFLKAVDIVADKRNKTFSELMAAEIEEHGLLVVMEKVAKYQERIGTLNTNVTATHEHTGIPATADFLAEAAGMGQVPSPEVVEQERSILPH